jgi:hypothetical protein
MRAGRTLLGLVQRLPEDINANTEGQLPGMYAALPHCFSSSLPFAQLKNSE